MKILFETSRISIEAEFNDTDTATTICENLPLESKVNTWGDEIYFPIPVTCKPESPTLDVEKGDIAYWPEGRCLCIFFGKTPASVSDKPKPASEVNIVGRVIGDLTILSNIKAGERIVVKKKENAK